MKTYTGRQDVAPGYYFNTTTRELVPLEKAGALPGTDGDRYYRVPVLVMLALAPLLGLAFVVFLPFIGFAIMLQLVAGKTWGYVGDAATHGVRVLRPSWAPTLAFLTRSKPASDAPAAEKPADEWQESVERKLTGDDHTQEG